MIRKGETVLDSLEVWERLAGPKSAAQWKEYRSAKECAHAWLAGEEPLQIPEELVRVLRTHSDFGTVIEWEAEPECLVPFDDYGGPANIDMLLSGRDEHGGLVMAIEAKADESFGPLVSRAMSDALERLLSSASSKGLARVRELTINILGPAEKGQPRLHQIRYQLLTASAAALARAKQERAARAVVMIHEFSTPRTKVKNRSRNSRDLVRFLKRLGMNDPDRVLGGELVGPVSVPGGARFKNPAPLYFGKATRQVEIRDRVD